MENEENKADAEMQEEGQESDFSIFKKLLNPAFKILAYHNLQSEITSLRIFHQPDISGLTYAIATCSDKTIKMFDFSLPEGTEIKPLRTFHDVVLKRKFAGAMIYNCEETDLYLIAGIEKAGELISYSVKGGSQYARVGNWKEGCDYITYFQNDMRNFMIVSVTNNMNSVVVWGKSRLLELNNFSIISVGADG